LKPADLAIATFPGVHLTKARPAVVLSVETYHLNRPDVIVGIITTQVPRPATPTDCSLVDWAASGLHAPSWFRLFLVTLPRINVRIIGELSLRDWAAVQICLRNGIELN